MASFSIYNTGNGSTKNFPDASQEQLITISLYDEQNFLNDSKSLGTIKGYMTKEFEYNATGNYTNIFNSQFGFSNGLLANILRDETQRNVMNYGLLTKKVYLNGESPVLDVSFRCWAGEDKGDQPATFNDSNDPVKVANALIGATLPRVGSDNIFNSKSTSDFLGNVLKTAGNVLKTAGNGYAAAGALALQSLGISTSATQEAIAAENSSNAIIDKIANSKPDDYVSKKPPVCKVTIGNIFAKDMMFVKSVSIKFSKEYLRKGIPLYGDFDVTLQSLFNAATLRQTGNDSDVTQENIFGSGLNKTNSTSRVSFDS